MPQFALSYTSYARNFLEKSPVPPLWHFQPYPLEVRVYFPFVCGKNFKYVICLEVRNFIWDDFAIFLSCLPEDIPLIYSGEFSQFLCEKKNCFAPRILASRRVNIPMCVVKLKLVTFMNFKWRSHLFCVWLSLSGFSLFPIFLRLIYHFCNHINFFVLAWLRKILDWFKSVNKILSGGIIFIYYITNID